MSNPSDSAIRAIRKVKPSLAHLKKGSSNYFHLEHEAEIIDEEFAEELKKEFDRGYREGWSRASES